MIKPTGPAAVLLALLLASACHPLPPAAGLAASDAGQVTDPRELVALTGSPAEAGRLEEVAARQGYVVEGRVPLPGLGLQLVTLRLPEGVAADRAIALLEGRAPGSTVGRNHAYRPPPEPDGRAGPRTYAGALIGWPEAGCPAQVPVGMIDTALDPGAVALGGSTLVSREISASAGTAHGTAVAGLLAGPGRLQGARIYHAAAVGEVPGASPAAGVDDILRAIEWLREEGVQLVNVSLAGPYNKILDRGLGAAADRGMVIVAAVGNDPTGLARYPAAFDFALAVTAVDADLAPYARAPRGAHIDFAAPGVDVYVPVGGGRYFSGTSIATPLVTALIAADPAAAGLGSAGEVRSRLQQAAVDLGAAGPDPTFGLGLAVAAPPCAKPAPAAPSG